MADIVCLGILVADVIARPIEKIPERGKLELVKSMELHTGGCASNTGISLAKLGIGVRVMGKVGEDGFGEFVLRRLQQENVDTKGIIKDCNTYTSATMALVQADGERSFIHYLGANAQLGLEDIDFDLVKGAKIFHIGGAFLLPKLDGQPMAEALKKAKVMGLTTSLDTAWDSTGHWLETIQPCLPYVDVFLPSLEEAKEIAQKNELKEIAHFFLERGVGTVALKMGERGSFVMNQRESFLIPALEVDAVDATGAGDAFSAGFLAGILKKWSLEKTGKFANAVGACCVMAMGATPGIKSLEETLLMFN